MKRYLLILALFNSGNYGVAVAENAREKELSHVSDFQYGDLVGKRYLTLTIFRDGNIVRTLRGESQRGGAFERDDPPFLSPDGNFVLLSQIESGDAEMSDGTVIYHEVAYCNLIDIRNGCILARDTGQFCGGTFTEDGKWKTPLYPDVNLANKASRSNDYAKGTLRSADSPVASFDNLLACDPPSDDNADAYRTIVENNLFDLDSARRDALERNLKERHLTSPLPESGAN